MAVGADASPAGADVHAKTKATPKTPVKKFTPRAAGRKLPWLDGKGCPSYLTTKMNQRRTVLATSAHKLEVLRLYQIISNGQIHQNLRSNRDIVTSTSPKIVARVQFSPSQPAPTRTAFERIGDRRLSNAIEGLEEMVQEAIDIADDADDRRHVEDIYEIIEDARAAIQDAAEDPTKHLIATTSPLSTSDSSTESGIIRLEIPHMHNGAQRDSASFDWAYPRHDNQFKQPPVTMWTLCFDPSLEISLVVVHAVVRMTILFTSIDTGTDIDVALGLDLGPDLGAGITGLPASAIMTLLSTKRTRQSIHMPIARNWTTGKKRITATIACINTALLGIVVGIYAGEVPRIQYFLADESHHSIVGNAVLYFGLAISTFIVWPLPLLHGRKPYLLAALALALPLQFPQALVVSQKRSPNDARFRAGLLSARAITGLVLGFANVNYITVLLDLFGASLQSKNPHQEYVVPNDVRRHGGGMGMWLGIWSWCWIGSLAIGFQIGAAIIGSLSPDWGFYIVIFILAAALILNIMAPETRRAAYRKSVTEVYDRDENYITRRVSRGECKLHISTEGPKYWFEEVWAGMKLMVLMMCQPGFFILSFYLAWIYAQIVLVIILLGALLSKEYKWQPRYVGAGVMSIAIGGFLAIPLTKARIFSRERKIAFRTDSMTFQKQVTWSSHLVRRAIFTLTLPLMGLAYTISSAGRPSPWIVPCVFAGALGFLSILAVAECHGLMMEAFDTCDLQPGVNTRHRLQSMAVQDQRRRTNYTSFPRVSAGIFASQTIAFILAGVANLVGGSMTRRLGAQKSTGATAGILLGFTLLLTMVLWRFKEVQVIPNHTFGTRRDTAAWDEFKDLEKMGRGADWKAVVIGHPSGKMRRMNVLELGALSRWTEIRKLNFLLKGPRLGEEKKKKARSFRGSW
ncbi:hypothetical protein SNOG_14179 [Parastagonospora nodorum SN15]|uniref:Major facilitator superfamily (MFS) profile domain-containing protein n=1 Tax=Phaeosphaeria nodorum (strain SN15 / ATCC MYA-4574 / FGSC 10173) TaxID=321614 RepID=Q0U212_PHANO|nr:hypothetical protein SNOG_14179 [Parastagonospora nodorum SN15]EAT78416.2 hypothetical protein SNOG_14179 [Parastagonospora nodorum SN15]